VFGVVVGGDLRSGRLDQFKVADAPETNQKLRKVVIYSALRVAGNLQHAVDRAPCDSTHTPLLQCVEGAKGAIHNIPTQLGNCGKAAAFTRVESCVHVFAKLLEEFKTRQKVALRW